MPNTNNPSQSQNQRPQQGQKPSSAPQNAGRQQDIKKPQAGVNAERNAQNKNLS